MNPVKAALTDTCDIIKFGKEEVFTLTEVVAAIRALESGKVASKNEIRSEMLKALFGEGVLWLKRVCQVVWKLGKTSKEWQIGVIIPIYKKGDCKECTNHRGISLLSFPGKVYVKCLERKCREIVESKLEDGQCCFRPCRSTTTKFSL